MTAKFNPTPTRRAFLKSTAGAACGLAISWPGLDASRLTRAFVANPTAELALVKRRLAAHYLVTAPAANRIGVDILLKTIESTGEWPDLEAQFKPEHAGIKRYAHCTRILKLAGAFRSETQPQRRTALRDALHRALNVWLGKPHPPSAAWFYQIGSPMALGQAAILFEEALTPPECEALVAILKTAVRPDGVLDYSGSPATGENLMHEASIQILAGCLANDPAYVARYAGQVAREIGPGRPESIQVDFSFHQHGPQFYSGGLYGQGFARDGAALAVALHQTAFAFAPNKVDALVKYVLDGIQPLARGRHFDFSTVGRMVSWPQMEGPDPESKFGAEAACAHLAQLGVARQAELRAFAHRLHGEAGPETAPVGNRVLWMSDYVSHTRPGFLASARMSSRRVHSHESGGKQNELGYHLGDGAMCLMQTGDEYHNIFPLWDWRRVPGVSCVYNPAVPFPLHTWGSGSSGGSDFAGGVSDGTAGAAAMELNRGGLRGRKSWFFLDDVVVCLGAGLVADDPTLPVVTSVNQCWARGSVATNQNQALPIGETHTQTAPGWVHHDGVSYLFPPETDLRIRTEHKSASWATLNTAPHRDARHDPTAPTPDVTGDVFSLWIEHGNGKTGSYSYLVAPGLKPGDISAFQQNKAPKILVNSPTLQAVASATTVQCVFWQAGTLDVPDYPKIRADQPCLVQWRRAANGRYTLAAGNPMHQVRTLNVRVEDSAATPIETTFSFPDDAYAGRPQVREFPKS
ncbi:MAG: hypothetical protein H7Z72_19620 [Bacteroidetes bacterium]|nr:hypothetical protein [Fibrella sp.]